MFVTFPDGISDVIVAALDPKDFGRYRPCGWNSRTCFRNPPFGEAAENAGLELSNRNAPFPCDAAVLAIPAYRVAELGFAVHAADWGETTSHESSTRRRQSWCRATNSATSVIRSMHSVS